MALMISVHHSFHPVILASYFLHLNCMLRPVHMQLQPICRKEDYTGVNNFMEQTLANTLWDYKSPAHLHWVGKNSSFSSFLRNQIQLRLGLKSYTCLVSFLLPHKCLRDHFSNKSLECESPYQGLLLKMWHEIPPSYFPPHLLVPLHHSTASFPFSIQCINAWVPQHSISDAFLIAPYTSSQSNFIYPYG